MATNAMAELTLTEPCEAEDMVKAGVPSEIQDMCDDEAQMEMVVRLALGFLFGFQVGNCEHVSGHRPPQDSTVGRCIIRTCLGQIRGFPPTRTGVGWGCF